MEECFGYFLLSVAQIIIGGDDAMNNKLVDSHPGSDMPVGDIVNGMSHVLKGIIYDYLNKAKKRSGRCATRLQE